MTNPNNFDLLKGYSLSSLSPDQQLEYLQNDPEVQRKYLAGEMEARLLVDTATRNYVEYQKQQEAEELKVATAKHGEFMKSMEAAETGK